MRHTAVWLLLAIATLARAQQRQNQLIPSLDGRELYLHYCATCHGPEAKGNGPFAKMIRLTPPDLTRITLRHHGAFPTQKVQQIIAGDSEVASHGPREMPLWGPVFSRVAYDQDFGKVRIANLTRYLQSLQAKPEQK